jgi:hypothetical protein
MALAGSIQLLAREETGPGSPARAGLQVGVKWKRTRAEEGNTKPKPRQLHSTTGAGALSGRFWGMLLGLIFILSGLIPPMRAR